MTQIVGKDVGIIGYGMMSLTARGDPLPDERALEAMRAALKSGCNLWNGAEFYGPEDNNSLILLEKFFARYPEDAGAVILCIKGGGEKGNPMVWNSSPENVRRSLNDCVAQLKGRKVIDLFEIARHDGMTPWETTLECLDQEFVRKGVIDGISLSEVRAETIHRAVKIAKINAVEVELSLMCTDILENGVAAACAEYGIPLVAYSPLAGGLLSGSIKSIDEIPAIRKAYPRFSPENFAINLRLVRRVEEMARDKGCTTSQFAINWVRCQSKKPGMPVIIPLPGGSTAEKVKENSKIVDISLEELTEIDAILAKFEVRGERYPKGIPTNT